MSWDSLKTTATRASLKKSVRKFSEQVITYCTDEYKFYSKNIIHQWIYIYIYIYICMYVSLIHFATKWSYNILLRKICQNKSFLWPVLPGIWTESSNMSLYGKLCVKENPYPDIFYTVHTSIDYQISKTSNKIPLKNYLLIRKPLKWISL